MAGVKGQVQRRGVERRKAIVQAALELFTLRGARGTSVADIAEQVGISAPAVLHHFGTKNDLLLAVVEERDRRGEPVLLDLIGDGGLKGFSGMVEAAVGYEKERGLMACYVVLEAENLQEGDIAHQYFVERAEVLRAVMADCIMKGQDRGEIRADVDPEAKGAEIVAFLSGAAVQWSLDPSLSLTAMYRSYFDALIRDLAT
jgi:AcrR family transcriptional regulator